MLRYVRLSRFSDICSSAFLRFLNDEDSSVSISEEEILVDIKSTKSRKRFLEHVTACVKLHTSFGTTLMLLRSCSPSKNWRRSEQTQNVNLTKRYIINDHSVLVCPLYLEEAIDLAWSKLDDSNSIKKIEADELDSIDLITLSETLIGEEFVKRIGPEYNLLIEANDFYDHHLPNEIPDYLLTKIETLFTKLEIL